MVKEDKEELQQFANYLKKTSKHIEQFTEVLVQLGNNEERYIELAGKLNDSVLSDSVKYFYSALEMMYMPPSDLINDLADSITFSLVQEYTGE